VGSRSEKGVVLGVSGKAEGSLYVTRSCVSNAPRCLDENGMRTALLCEVDGAVAFYPVGLEQLCEFCEELAHCQSLVLPSI
jgi:hypothetical protein